MVRSAFLFVVWLSCAIALPAAAQPRAFPQSAFPHDVDLKIENVPQQTMVWCWAAVAEQIIRKNGKKSPPQCALVAMAHGQDPSYCCPYNDRCAVPGTLSQI